VALPNVRRVAPSRTPVPLELGATRQPVVPTVEEVVAGPDAVPQFTDEDLAVAAEEVAKFAATLHINSEVDHDEPATGVPEGSSPEVDFSVHASQAEALAAAGLDVPDVAGETVELTRAEYLIVSMIESVGKRQEEIAAAVQVIGQHQQWLTDTVAGTKADFDKMMAGGNPLKMLGAMMGAGKKGSNG
jgi:hypothetical protein